MRLRKLLKREPAMRGFSELGLGTSPIGNLYKPMEDAVSASIMRAAWDCGVRYFDTAPMYGHGLAETRLNSFLRSKPRDDYLISTKVGRVLQRIAPACFATASSASAKLQKTIPGEGNEFWFDVPSRRILYDYTYDGVMRSVEHSLERTGLDRFDILMVHDLDIRTHGSQSAFLQMTDIFFKEGGYDALIKLKDEGVTRAIGSGQNDIECSQMLAERGDFDIFLIAGRYTLLEQEPLNTFLPLCERQDIGVVIGGPYNSGILATGPVPGAYYNYSTAQPPVMERVTRIQSICRNHGVRLIEAAFHFPLLHRQVLSVIPGAASVEQMEENSAIAAAPPPGGLWQELKAVGLLHDKAPTTSEAVS